MDPERTSAPSVDPRTVVLVSLAAGTGVLDVVFGKKELRARKDRIERIGKGEVTGEAAREAVEAAEAAMLVTVVLPAVMTTVVH